MRGLNTAETSYKNKAYLFCLSSFLIYLSIFLFSCSHSNVKTVTNPSIYSDSDYNKVLSTFTRSAFVSDALDSKFRVYATFISEEFRSALQNRYNFLYEKSQELFSSQGTSFLVSLYTNDSTLSNLDDKKIWSIYLEQNGARIDEYQISTISDKNRTRPFFDYINNWSREFILTFDTKPSTELKLFISNSDGKVKFSW